VGPHGLQQRFVWQQPTIDAATVSKSRMHARFIETSGSDQQLAKSGLAPSERDAHVANSQNSYTLGGRG